MTEEIFRRDGYLSEFEAAVTEVKGDSVKLDSTAFYPGGGGQVCDTGEIRGMRVTEVRYEGADIVHTVPNNDLKVGDMVWCSVDWDRRFDLMQGHTGEHLLFNSLRRQDPDVSIVKIYISPESKYVIIDREMDWEKVRAAVAFANKVIRDNLPVTHSIMSRDDPALKNVRIKLDRIEEGEEITVVEIGDVDIAACSGIHVMETSELGALFVNRIVSAGKGEYAVHFEIGDAAIDSAMSLANTCLQAVDAANSKPEDIVRTVANMGRELETCRRMLKEAGAAALRAMEPEDVCGTPVYAGCVAADRTAMTEAAERFKGLGGVAVLVSSGDTVSVMLASGTPAVDCRAILPEALKAFGGRGGGKPDFAQGGIPDPAAAADLLKALMERVRGALAKN